MPTSSSPKVQIDVRGVCFTVETLKLSSYSPFLASVFNSINVCPCEPQLLIMTDLQPDQVEEALGALAGKRKQSGVSSEVLEILGISYCYHLTEEETFDCSLLDLMETTLSEVKNLQIPPLSDISNSPQLDKAAEAAITKIEQAQMKAIKTGLESQNFHFNNSSSSLQKNDQERMKSSLQKKERAQVDFSSKICPICSAKIEKENYPDHVFKYHWDTIQEQYVAPVNLLEIESFKEKKKVKLTKAAKDENKNMIVDHNPRNKCPICLRINIKRMSDHMKIHNNLTMPPEMTKKQLEVVVEKLKTDSSKIFSVEVDVLARVQLEKQKCEEGVYRVVSGLCKVCLLPCELRQGLSCSSCSHWWHYHCLQSLGKANTCPDCGRRERAVSPVYQALYRCAICNYARKSPLQLRNHYSTEHFREQLKAHIDTRGNCRLCGVSPKNIYQHLGSVHNMVESLIPKQISVVFRKLQ